MISKWENDTFDFEIMLSGDNYEITLSSVYEDINYEEEIDTSGI